MIDGFVRKSTSCFILFAITILVLGLMVVHAHMQRQADGPLLDRMAGIVRDLELTDLALFTEARYTRHLSQTDLNSAFQDHPVGLEHFPTGAIVGPPEGMRRWLGTVD